MAGSGFLACRRCGALLESHFCTTCGLDSRCSKCGATVTTPFCVGCGTSAAPTVRSSIPPSRNHAEQEGDNSSAAPDGNGEAPETVVSGSAPSDVSLIAEIEYPVDASTVENGPGIQADDVPEAPKTTVLAAPSSLSHREHSDDESSSHTPESPRLIRSGRRRKVLAAGIVAFLAVVGIASLAFGRSESEQSADQSDEGSETTLAFESTTSTSTSTTTTIAVTIPPPTEPPPTSPPTTARRVPVATTPQLVGLTTGPVGTILGDLFSRYGITAAGNMTCPPETTYMLVCTQYPAPGTPLYPGDRIRWGFGR